LNSNLALVFGGQGSQFTGMGKIFYETFSESKCVFNIASEVVGYDVSQICFEASQKELSKTMYCQICPLAVELAIYNALKKVNMQFDAVAGFSLGEYAALVVAGMIDIKTAFKLVKDRALAMETEVSDNAGRMVAVINLCIEDVDAICKKIGYTNASIANYNAFNQVSVSVSTEVFDDFIYCVKLLNGVVIPLKVSRPFHHLIMQPAANKFKDKLINVVYREPLFPTYMNVTGEPFSANDSLVDELYEHIVKPVQWIKTIQNMRVSGIDTFYEISPRPTLGPFINNITGGKATIIDVQKVLLNRYNHY